MAADIELSIENLTWVKYMLTHNIANEEVTPSNDPSPTDQDIQGCINVIDIVIKDLTDFRDGR